MCTAEYVRSSSCFSRGVCARMRARARGSGRVRVCARMFACVQVRLPCVRLFNGCVSCIYLRQKTVYHIHYIN